MIKDIMFVERVEGRDKPNYHKIGIVMIKDDGKMSIKLNSVPVGVWNGWLSVFDQKPKTSGPIPEVESGIEPF